MASCFFAWLSASDFCTRQPAAEKDKIETAAWYGRGEKPEEPTVEELVMADLGRLDSTADAGWFKLPAKPGLLVVQGEGRYQGLGFDGEGE